MKADQQLSLDVCPHCGISHPTLTRSAQYPTQAHNGQGFRQWSNFTCSTCGGITLTVAPIVNNQPQEVTEFWPAVKEVSKDVPERARAYLVQALASKRAPAGAIMLAASSIDSMLKDKGFKVGSLNARINDAAAQGVITQEMATWAHEIRLDANDQRHADESAPLPTETDVDRVIAFARTLAEFLYVIPAMVASGRSKNASAQ